ncbi:MAG TPA: hypothetical protein VK501_22935, partial [Baekduia sp.]|uniref:hypothetical protein n=1 Tax=Baekduia sp. TaxID=2600305 RepID=UPI002C47FDD0
TRLTRPGARDDHRRLTAGFGLPAPGPPTPTPRPAHPSTPSPRPQRGHNRSPRPPKNPNNTDTHVRSVDRGLVALLVLGGGGTAAALITKHNTDEKHQRELAAAAHRRADAQRRARLAQIAADRVAAAERRAQEAKDAATRSIRRSLVSDLRKAITKDARGRVADGYLDGPIYGTQCDPVGGGNASNLDARTGRYSCLAYNKKNDDGTIEGYGFTATVNFEKFSYQWHLGNS